MVPKGAHSHAHHHFAPTRFALCDDLHVSKDGKGKGRESDFTLLLRALKYKLKRGLRHILPYEGDLFNPSLNDLRQFWWVRRSDELDGESIPRTGFYYEQLNHGYGENMVILYTCVSAYVDGRRHSKQEGLDPRFELIGRLAEKYRRLVRVIMHLAGTRHMGKNFLPFVSLTADDAAHLADHTQFLLLKKWCRNRGFDFLLTRRSSSLMEVSLVSIHPEGPRGPCRS